MRVQVNFTYDEPTRKWEVLVIGVETELEAKQAFNAVVLTCGEVVVGLEHRIEPKSEGFLIIPAV